MQYLECEKCPEGWSQIVPLARVTSLQNKQDGSHPKRLQCIKQFTEEKTSWYRAKAICLSHKSHLLEINSAFEKDEVQPHANSKFLDIHVMSCTVGPIYFLARQSYCAVIRFGERMYSFHRMLRDNVIVPTTKHNNLIVAQWAK